MLYQPSCSESVIRLDLEDLNKRFTEEERQEIFKIIKEDYRLVSEEPIESYSHLRNDENRKCFYWYQTEPDIGTLEYLNEKGVKWDGEFPFAVDDEYDKIATEHEAEELKDKE